MMREEIRAKTRLNIEKTNEDKYQITMAVAGFTINDLNINMQNDALIVVSHCSPDRHPGGSAVYYDGFGEYSEIVSVIEGTRSVDMLLGTVERWGDYAGIQRFYDQPGNIWAAFSYGRPGNVHETWIAKIARPDVNVATEDLA